MRVSPWEKVPRGEDTPGPGGTCAGKGSSLWLCGSPAVFLSGRGDPSGSPPSAQMNKLAPEA